MFCFFFIRLFFSSPLFYRSNFFFFTFLFSFFRHFLFLFFPCHRSVIFPPFFSSLFSSFLLSFFLPFIYVFLNPTKSCSSGVCGGVPATNAFVWYFVPKYPVATNLPTVPTISLFFRKAYRYFFCQKRSASMPYRSIKIIVAVQALIASKLQHSFSSGSWYG